MASLKSSESAAPARSQPTHTSILASGPSPTLAIDCDTFFGLPLLASQDGTICGTKTNNSTLMRSCCNGAEVIEALRCFQHCEVDTFDMNAMRDFVACLSTGGNFTSQLDGSAVDANAFCQGPLNSTIAVKSSTASAGSGSKSTGLFIFMCMVALMFCETATAECVVTIEESSSLIRQGEARAIGTGTRCSTGSSYCIIDQTGTDSFVAANRTIAGDDASDNQYDEFFEALGRSTTPPRLFAASLAMEIRQWAVGITSDNLINYSLWAPFMVS